MVYIKRSLELYSVHAGSKVGSVDAIDELRKSQPGQEEIHDELPWQ